MSIRRRFGLLLLSIAPLVSCAASQAPFREYDSRARSARLMPPATLACERNELTSYTGRVTSYRRTADMTAVVINTDAGTTEKVEVRHADAATVYLLNGSPFTDADWPRIESEDGELLPGTRVTAWVCLDGKTAPVLDWRPAPG